MQPRGRSPPSHVLQRAGKGSEREPRPVRHSHRVPLRETLSQRVSVSDTHRDSERLTLSAREAGLAVFNRAPRTTARCAKVEGKGGGRQPNGLGMPALAALPPEDRRLRSRASDEMSCRRRLVAGSVLMGRARGRGPGRGS